MAWGRRLGQAPRIIICGVQNSYTPWVQTYPRRTESVYAMDAGMWGRPLNKVRGPSVSIRGIHTSRTPQVCPHPRRTLSLYATDADRWGPPFYFLFLVYVSL
jgi:hypothetical protein